MCFVQTRYDDILSGAIAFRYYCARKKLERIAFFCRFSMKLFILIGISRLPGGAYAAVSRPAPVRFRRGRLQRHSDIVPVNLAARSVE